jgi:hypothetical protein
MRVHADVHLVRQELSVDAAYKELESAGAVDSGRETDGCESPKG